MNFPNIRIFGIFLCLSIFSYECCGEAIDNKDIDMNGMTNKIVMTEKDLLRNYETLSRNAVTRDTAIVSDMRSDKDKYVSINNGHDFNIPINDNIMSRPIGTYQYIDANKDLHIVNFINDKNGLRILNDYKPYASSHSPNKLKTMPSNDLKTKNQQNKKKNDFSDGKQSVGSESDKDINYDEYEFTFISDVMPQNINKSVDKNNNKINDLNTEESHKNVDKLSPNGETNKLVQNNDNNYQEIQRLTQLMNSMPLPQPFSAPSHSKLPFFRQMPPPTNDNWRGPPMYQSPSYGIPGHVFASSFGVQPVLNWNPNY